MLATENCSQTSGPRLEKANKNEATHSSIIVTTYNHVITKQNKTKQKTVKSLLLLEAFTRPVIRCLRLEKRMKRRRRIEDVQVEVVVLLVRPIVLHQSKTASRVRFSPRNKACFRFNHRQLSSLERSAIVPRR